MGNDNLCCVCEIEILDDNDWYCENCGGAHHPKCSGYSQEGSGEYYHEDELSVCKNCTKKSSPNLKSTEKCMFSVDGKCNSDYSTLECNGKDIPEACPYSQNLNKANIDEVGTWDRTNLTDEEVSLIHGSTSGGKE